MRTINRKIKNFLLNKIKATNNNKQINYACIAIKAIENGYITEHELKIMGYKD